MSALMMKSFLVASLFALGVSSTATPPIASLLKRQSNTSSDARPTSYPVNTIDMPIDHFPNSSRYEPHTTDTFKQVYYFDDTYYKPGGPIFLYIGGETSGESRWPNLQTGIIQILMNATNGLGVILENRYYGQSQPFNTTTTDQLRFMTTEQTIADNAYFAQHATFGNATGNVSAPDTPWILYGGSLAGGQTAFSLVQYTGLLWAGIASSGVIHPVLTYPEWYNPIQKFGPQDCIANINGIVDKMDALVAANNTAAIQQLKDIFGLGAVSDIRDFAMVIAWPIGGPFNYPTYTWQELNWYPAYDNPDFFYFCNNVTNVDAPDNITSVDYALANYTNGEPWTGLGNYANYVKEVIVSTCPSEDLFDTPTCFGFQNASWWADTTNSVTRAYLYTTCTEAGAYQAAARTGPSLLSRVVQADYTQQWCTWAFPPGEYNAIPSTPNLTEYTRYGDLNLTAPRLALIDGAADVWNDLCYHSSNATLRTGADQFLITGGGHHWDSYGILDVDAEPDYIRAAHEWEIRRVKAWLKEFDDQKATKRRRDEL